MRRYTEAIARGIGVRGLLNVQYALKDDVLYVLEANPRASRTVPFVSKATAVPLAKAAARIMLGATIAELRAEGMLLPTGDGGDLPEHAPIAVKEAVLPFKRFRTPDRQGHRHPARPGDEVDRRGDGHRHHLRARVRQVAGGRLRVAADQPARSSSAVANRDKRGMIFPVKRLADLGFEIVATAGTGEVLRRHGVDCEVVRKHFETTAGRAGRRRVGGRADRGRRGRPGHQHAAGLAARPAATGTRSAAPRSPPTSRASPRCRAPRPR